MLRLAISLPFFFAASLRLDGFAGDELAEGPAQRVDKRRFATRKFRTTVLS
jgi:hypothetical protein